MKVSVSVLFIMLFFTLLSCNNDNGVTPDNNTESKISKKLFYNNIDDKIPYRSAEFTYDSEKRLEKITYYSLNSSNPIQYEFFEYNENNKISQKFGYYYVNDTTSWKLNYSTSYIYYDGKLLNEETVYFSDPVYKIFYKYERNNSDVVRKYLYENHQFKNYTEYNYSESLCVKETVFSDSAGEKISEFTMHFYEDKRLIKSELYINNNKVQEIKYTYNDKGRLISEEAIPIDTIIVKPLNYFIVYEYFD